MHLMFSLDPLTGRRTYTLKKVVNGQVTKSAHPARFSPDDKFSMHRVTLKKRYKMLPTQMQDPPVRALGDVASAAAAAVTTEGDAERVKIVQLAKVHELNRAAKEKQARKESWGKK